MVPSSGWALARRGDFKNSADGADSPPHPPFQVGVLLSWCGPGVQMSEGLPGFANVQRGAGACPGRLLARARAREEVAIGLVNPGVGYQGVLGG